MRTFGYQSHTTEYSMYLGTCLSPGLAPYAKREVVQRVLAGICRF